MPEAKSGAVSKPFDRQEVSPSRFAQLLPARLSTSAAYGPFVMHVVDATPLEASATFSDPVLGLITRGRHRVRRKIGSRLVEGWSDPGTINIIPAHCEATFEASGSSRGLVLFAPEAFLARVVAEHWNADPRTIEIVPQFLIRDPVIEAVATRLELEARSGGALGSLYAESACEFLAHHLIRAYSTLSKPAPQLSGGLSARRLKNIVAYIEENLPRSIALRELAALSGVGARHFERAFRQSMGIAPHAYLLRRRLLKARELLLRRPLLSVEQIAQQVGFSSSSHLALAFRRQTGYSPTEFRRTYT
jgi:AraC family transcriptional regulator